MEGKELGTADTDHSFPRNFCLFVLCGKKSVGSREGFKTEEITCLYPVGKEPTESGKLMFGRVGLLSKDHA